MNTFYDDLKPARTNFIFKNVKFSLFKIPCPVRNEVVKAKKLSILEDFQSALFLKEACVIMLPFFFTCIICLFKGIQPSGVRKGKFSSF